MRQECAGGRLFLRSSAEDGGLCLRLEWLGLGLVEERLGAGPDVGALGLRGARIAEAEGRVLNPGWGGQTWAGSEVGGA